MNTPKVIFLPVKTTQAKLQAIAGVARHYFINNCRLLFSVSTSEAALYVDELLWKFPPDSFLPHAILKRPAKELIAITTADENLNDAAILFNLRPKANPMANSFAITYDFFDETHPTKTAQSQIRKETYLKLGLLLN